MQLIGAGERHREVRDPLAQKEARVGPGQPLRGDLARAGANERPIAERERALARARVCIARETEGAALADEPGAGLARLRTVFAEEARDVDLQQRAVLDVWLEPVERAADSLRMGEEEAVAEAREPGDGGVEDVIEPGERAFEEEPARVLGTLGDQ